MISNIRRMMHKVARSSFQIISDLFVRILSLADDKGYRILGFISMSFSRFFPYYFTNRLVPKYPTSQAEGTIHISNIDDVAIVIQGVLTLKDEYTLETVKLYKQLFGGAKIIVSTWDYSDPCVVDLIRNEGCDVILNKAFKPSGFGNVNYQICTSLAGIRKAKELGAKYTIKTRTDQRVCKKTALSFLKNLVNTFDVKDDRNLIGLNGRIVALSGSLLLPLYFTDYFYFGYTEDMEKLFDIPYEPRDIPSSQKYYGKTYGWKFSADKFYVDIPAEVYIISQFLQKYMSIEYTVNFYWDIIKKYFITIDYEDIGLLWPKYGYNLLPWDAEHNSLSTFMAILANDLEYDYNYENYQKQLIIDITRFS